MAVKKELLCEKNCQILLLLYFITLSKLLLCSFSQEQIGIQRPNNTKYRYGNFIISLHQTSLWGIMYVIVLHSSL